LLFFDRSPATGPVLPQAAAPMFTVLAEHEKRVTSLRL
jgi:hypothetical protein